MDTKNEHVPLTARVALGQRVLTSDEQELGVVARTTSKDFEVNPAHGPKYWLERQEIVGEREDAIVVTFDLAALDGHRLLAHKADMTETPVELGEDEVTTLSEEEREEQRVQMERELAAQRAQLPRDADSAPDAPPDTGGTYGEPVEAEVARREHRPTGDVVEQAREAGG